MTNSCSRKCAAIVRAITGKKIVVNTCKQCSKEFIATRTRKQQDFCSRHCSKQARRNGSHRNCLLCNKEFYVIPSRIIDNKTRGKYCGDSCRLKDWKDKSLKKEMPGNYRANAWKVYEKKCYDCGYSLHPEILIIHHIDGDRKNGSIVNLVPLCQNCHSLRHLAMGGDRRISNVMFFKAIK